MEWNEYDSRRFAWLADRAWNVYTQNGEDGLIEAIFERIGTANKWCFECGAADGLFFSNTRRLIEAGWSAVLVEADDAAYSRLVAGMRGITASGRGGDGAYFVTGTDKVTAYRCMALPEGPTRIDALLEAAGAPEEIDLLCIDVDGQDWYLFNSLWKYRPRVLLCEYAPDADLMFIPELGGDGQAGRHAIQFVGDARGYKPIAATRYNVVFVRDDLIDLVADPLPGEAAPGGDALKVGMAMSTGRLGFLNTVDCIYTVAQDLRVTLARSEGVWWHHCLTRAIEAQVAAGMDYVITLDHDSIFTKEDVAKLVCHLYDNPDVDIIAPLQMKREGGEPLITTDGEVVLNNALVPMRQAHFGLTIFRRSVFDRISKPWFLEAPDEHGGWGEGRTDPDIHFWNNCKRAGIVSRMATDVVIGHLEQVVTWPTQNLTTLYQSLYDWRKGGKPAAAFRKPASGQSAAMEMQ